jgi:hypothetical protein
MPKSPSPTRRPKPQLAKQLADLQRSARSKPGVADLIKLYTEHAAIVEKARTYTTRPSRVITLSSSDATA